MKEDVKQKLNEIMMATRTEIMVRLENPGVVSPSLLAVDSVGELTVEVRGSFSAMHRANVECLIYFDELVQCFKLPLLTLYRWALQSIQYQSNQT